MIEATLLLAIPLGLRWFTARWTRQWNRRVQGREERVEALIRELDSLLDASRQLEQQMSQYVSKRSHLGADIAAKRDELKALRESPAEKMAA